MSDPGNTLDTESLQLIETKGIYTHEGEKMNKKIMTVDYENFTQVTTAGHVIETIRADILFYHHELEKTENIHVNVLLAKVQALQSLLNTLTLQELKMDAWQEMKGSEKITGDLYKQLANQDLFKYDKL